MEVTDASFEKEVSQNKGVSIVDFWAPWCGPCKMVAPVFTQLSEEMKDVKFAKVNVDDNQIVPSKFGVQSIPTFVVIKDGKEVGRKMGAMSKDMLSGWIKAFI